MTRKFNRNSGRNRWAGAGFAALLTGLAAAPAVYAQEATVRFSIPAQPLSAGLLALGKQAGISIAALNAIVAGKTGNAVQGELSVRSALTQMLANTGLRFEFVRADAVRVMESGADSQSSAPSGGSSEVTQLTELVVTGTHIKGAPPAGSELVTLSSADIALVGRPTVTDLVRTIPQVQSIGATEALNGDRGQGQFNNQSMASSVNLRGLGADATLVLVNGRRVAPTAAGAFVDISQIPLAAIERVEIVPDGASALYGSDAVGGVVNFVLKRKYTGADSSVRYGAGNGFDEYTVDQTMGVDWGTGSAMLAYEYYSRSHLKASDRGYFQSDLTGLGGDNFDSPQSSNPGNIYDPNTGIYYAIPKNQNGKNLTSSELIPNTENLQNLQTGADILPSQQRNSFVASINQDLTPRVHVYADILYSTRNYQKLTTAASEELTVPNTNPFFVNPNPAATSTTVFYSFVDDYKSVNVGQSTNYTITPGAKVDLSGDWTAELYGSYGRDDASTNFYGAPNTFRLNAALADPNPATAFDPFGDGSNTPAATLASIAGSIHYRNIYEIGTVNLGASGSLFDLPGGAVRLALGGEYRTEQLTTTSLIDQDQPTPYSLPSDGATRRSIVAGYAELLTPIVGKNNAVPGIERLDLSLAVRTEHYSDFGSTTNPKVGLTWKPTQSLSLRGSWGTSFKAPGLEQLNEGQNAYFGTPFPNPNYALSPQTEAFPGYSNTVVLIGFGNKNLKPETATSWTIGGDFKPQSIPGLQMGLTYFSVDFKNRIGALTEEEATVALAGAGTSLLIPVRNPTQAQLNALYSSSAFLGPMLPANQVLAIVNLGVSNFGAVEERGLDANIGYRFTTDAGAFGLDGSVTYLTKYAVQQQASEPFVNALNTISNPDSVHARVSADWTRGPYEADIGVNYTGAYTNNLLAPVLTKVSAWTTADAHISYTVAQAHGPLHGVILSLDVRNILDSKPPFVNNEDSKIGYDPELADPLGRVVSMMVRKTW